jgi:hypothetical protein
LAVCLAAGAAPDAARPQACHAEFRFRSALDRRRQFLRRRHGNNYGYRKTNTAGGKGVGEAGGTFFRAAGENYYADTNLGGAQKLSDAIEASGRFVAGNVAEMKQRGCRSGTAPPTRATARLLAW